MKTNGRTEYILGVALTFKQQTTKSIILAPRKLCCKSLRCVLQLAKGSFEPRDRSIINAKDFLDFIDAISGDFELDFQLSYTPAHFSMVEG